MLFLRHVRIGVVMTSLGLIMASPTQASDPGKASVRADKLVVFKAARKLQLMKGGEVLRSFRVALGPNPKQHKVREGDGRTPEGRYVLDWRNAKSRYYRSIHISYPNAHDRRKAAERDVSPGGDIMIHGLPNGYKGPAQRHSAWDWTAGCIAVTNAEIDVIWSLVENGTPIEINP